jgi:hypothetical protein
VSARELYRNFRGAVARSIVRTGVRFGGEWITARGQLNILIPREMAVVGQVNAIEYDCVREGKRLKARHVFAPGSRPAFAVGTGRGELFILGDMSQFTDRGIVDFTPAGRKVDYDEKTGKTRLLKD